MRKERISALRELLDDVVERTNRPGFIVDDPVSIPHQYSVPADIEISGLFAATLAWGQRGTIIRNSKELMRRMDNAPHDFILNHRAADLRRMETFVHRTFNSTDLLYFISFLRSHYRKYSSLESLFRVSPNDDTIEKGLINFHDTFFSLPHAPRRTRKHVSTPERKSACKRLNMYLRWMVRHDRRGVDFGLWKSILPRQLVCPCDLHVDRVARKLKLIKRKAVDWQTALELTANLRLLNAEDPVRYDFALFGLGVTGWRRVSGGR